ncbi:hypothetical protein V6C53_12035 [Desulfocurvibacter africanus]|nr:hypothetical protein [Desulfocurvibacter africanus]
MTVKLFVSLAYLGVVFYLGYVGWKHTREAADYMLGGFGFSMF